MFCTPYEQGLRDAAASGESLSVDSRQHLSACADCSAAWNQEQALFAAIDLELQAAVRSEVPPSLIAGTRQLVAASAPPMMRWKPALAFGAGLLVAAGLAIRVAIQTSGAGAAAERIQTTAPDSRTSQKNAEITSANGFRLTPQVLESAGQTQITTTRHAMSPGNSRPIVQQISTQVLASPAEAIGLEQYMRFLRSRTKLAAAREDEASEEAKNRKAFEIRDVEFKEIDLGVMSIPPLDGAR